MNRRTPTHYAAVERDGCIAEIALIDALPAIVAGEGQINPGAKQAWLAYHQSKGRQILALTRADLDLLPGGLDKSDREHNHPAWPL